MAQRLGAIRLDDRLGEGAQGFVWGGLHEPSGTPVAVKVVVAERARDPVVRARFRHEAAAVAALDHPRVVRVYDQGAIGDPDAGALGVPPGSPYLVMSRARTSLRAWPIPMPWDRVRRVLLQILEGLAHAHAHGIVHCDLKRANVLSRVAPRSGEPDLLLADFGVAVREADDAPIAGGTPLYMAPELIAGAVREVGPWTDLYALGWIAWELGCGVHPLHAPGRSPRHIAHDQCFRPAPAWPDDAPPLGPWVARLLEKDGRRRFRSAADARAVLLGEAPGVPARRRRPPVATERAPLLGAGLGLYGLRAIPLIGREVERDALWDAFGACAREGRPSAVVVRGAAGNGKTRLAHWLCTEVLETGSAEVFRATHAPIAGVADGLGAMLARWLRIQGERGALALAAVEDLLRDAGLADGVDPEAVLELLRPALAPGTRSAHAFGSDAERHDLLGRILGGLAARRPVVLWIDDGQWGIDALALVRTLVERGSGAVLAVVTIRDEALAEAPGALACLAAIGGTTIEIGPLPEADRGELARELLGLHGTVAARVGERTGGNPLFAVHLVGDWIQRGLLVPGPGGFVLAEGAEVPLPDGLHAVWTARIERLTAALGPGASSVLEVAAALGQEVAGDEWRAATGRLGLAVEAPLVDALLAARLATVPRGRPDGLAFVHAMIRESLERTARDALRAPEQHLACARALKELGADAGRIGAHLVRAGELAEGVEQLQEAAWAAYLEGAFSRGHALLDAVEAALPGLGPARARVEGTTWMRRGRLLVREGRADEGSALLVRAADRFREDGPPSSLRVALDHIATARLNVGDADGAAAAAAEAVASGERAGDARALRYTRPTLALARWWQGHTDGVLAVLEEAIASRRAAGEEVAFLEIAAAELMAERGDLSAAVERSERAITLHERTEPRGTLSMLLANHATVACIAGRYPSAEAALRRALEIDLRAGSRHARSVRWLLGVVACLTGAFDDAGPWLADATPDRSPTATLAAFARMARAAVGSDVAAFDGAAASIPDADQRRGSLHRRLARVAAEAWEAAGDGARAARARALGPVPSARALVE